ncbi:MAG: class I SAM-dependent methyltransferase [Terracidiphilus sp.]
MSEATLLEHAGRGEHIREQQEARIRSVYAHRDQSGKRALYAWSNPDVLLNVYRFHAVAAACLRRAGLDDLSGLRVLDVGCGSGGWLRQLLAWGASVENLHGIDLLADRIDRARQLAPKIDHRVGSGWQLPFDSAAMNLVTAHTVFSSILDADARQSLAAEMLRVVAPQGSILIFDFRISHPRNRNTIGIRKSEIRRLFLGFELDSHSLELAPPIARKIAPVAPVVALALEALCPLLRTHSMHLLQRVRLNGAAILPRDAPCPSKMAVAETQPESSERG